MKKLYSIILVCSFWDCHAQEDSTKYLQEVIITGIQNTASKNTALNLEGYSLQQLDNKAPFNLSDALANIPGISELTTGNSISKPVIRGLYGDRILILLSGLRFDNQQFQDEHGLGLSQIGIDRTEIIKGPSSILYGTDAIGGIINVIEETPDKPGKAFDITTRFYSNTLGTLTDIGYYNYNKNKTWWRLRGGIESHADYADGNSTRILDSRNTGYYCKAGFGFTRKNWISNNSYNFSYNQFGFIIPDLGIFMKEDGRWSRSMQGPHHIVMLNVFSSQNTFQLQSSTLKINAGFQSNHRMEDEGGGEISLNMHLISGLESAKWEKKLRKNVNFILNQQFTYEKNINLGKRILIPDANMMEGNLSGFLHFSFNKLSVEAGTGINYKQIETFLTIPLNTPGKNVHPFNIGRAANNSMIGICYNDNDRLNMKFNISSGDRAPNLAELSSDGLHEGYYRYEIGNKDLKMEQNINGDATMEYNTDEWFISTSVYYNRFFNYIYLAPSSETYYGFPVYYFKQQDATIYGNEVILAYKPETFKHYEIKEVFTTTKALLDDGGYLPFIPAYKNNLSITFKRDISKKVKSLYLEPEFEYVFKQDKPAQFETPTPSYGLINIYTGIVTMSNKRTFNWQLCVKNIFNIPYYDHLSRLSDLSLFNPPINNIGRNFVLSLSTKL